MLKFIPRFRIFVRGANFIGVLFLIPLMLIATMDVIMRGFFNFPISGGLEMSQFMMVIIIWFTMAMTAQKKGHVAMQFIESRLSKRAIYLGDCMVLIVMIITMVLVDWALLERMLAAYENGETTDVLAWPIYPALGVMLLGGILLVLELIAELWTLLYIKNGEDESKGFSDSTERE